jgi:TonB family protein
MDATRILVAALPLALAWPAASLAQQWRCDCTSVVASCSANVTPKGSYLEIKTDEKMCARVDYFVDGLPFVSVVVDGEDRQDWLARTDSPKIMVQSCQVCRDNASAGLPRRAPTAAPPSAGDSSGEPEALRPLIASMPTYPETARQRRVEGYVDVEFTVNAQGNVEQPRVVGSQPSGVFDAAALAAVSRWRYPPAQDRAPQTLQQRVEFKPETAPAASASSPAATAGPRNQCVREDAIYNYGEVIDVGFINACADALMVFGCAEGTGRYAGRWICNDSEQQGNVLVPQNDRRLGSRYSAGSDESVRMYTYTDGFSVTRAPNSQYWLVACGEGDSQCRADARQWVRSVAGQPVNVDPQDRSRVELARSN